MLGSCQQPSSSPDHMCNDYWTSLKANLSAWEKGKAFKWSNNARILNSLLNCKMGRRSRDTIGEPGFSHNFDTNTVTSE